MARGKPGPSALPGPSPIVTRRPKVGAEPGTAIVRATPDKRYKMALEDRALGIPFHKGFPDSQRGSRKHVNLSRYFIITEEDMRGRPLSGSPVDSDRVRTVKAFYEALPDRRPLYADVTKEVVYAVPFITPTRPVTIGRYQVPEARTLIIDDVQFFATPAFGLGLIAPGIIEGFIQFTFKLSGNVPALVTNGRLPAGGDEAGFPFLGDRVGAKEVTFSWYASTGQDIEAQYVVRAVPPVPINTIGVRVRGWLVETTMFEAIRRQQE